MQTLPNSSALADLDASPRLRLGQTENWLPVFRGWVNFLLLFMAAGFLALHFVHLSADFPNFSRWMDWSKYTDEGWYGDAAIRHFQLGHWYVAGDFNPAVALPVWPLLEVLVFEVTGVSLIAARALSVSVFGGILLASWLLIARSALPSHAKASRLRISLTASVAVLLLAASPFCFVFVRLAILEPLLILLMLLALLAAQSASRASVRGTLPDATQHASLAAEAASLLRQNAWPVISLALLLPLIVLTKTTGIFLVPAIAWMLFGSLGHRLRPFLMVGVPAALSGFGLWLGYFLLCVRPHLLLDYRYLFSANAYTGIDRRNFFSVLWFTLHGCAWIGDTLFGLALTAAGFALLRPRRLADHPLIPALTLWAAGYGVFLAYHNNLQPRYYLVIAVPLTLLVPVVLRDLVLPVCTRPRARIAALSLASVAFAAVLIPDARQTISYVRHPQYTLLNAARQISRYIADEHRRDPAHSTLVLSISGSDLSLMTGLHSICDDFGTWELAERAKRYNPGWYLAWNLIEDDKMDSLAPNFHVERVATFPAMDDQDRNLLILYRLTPLSETGKINRRNRRSRGRLGQRPSVSQLAH